MVTFEEIRNSEEIRTYIRKGNENLGVLGFTEHAFAHAMRVSQTAADILTKLGRGEREIELARIAGYMHDIGNCINRHDHAHNGALMAMSILRGLGMEAQEAAVVIAAIGHHDEKTGTAVDAVSAALILADKCDVRRSRVRARNQAEFDIHDRVNYAAVNSALSVNDEAKTITLDITLDDAMCSVMDYFEIFLERMVMCRRAAEMLGCRFRLTANGSRML
ncbi:MAG: HD domain-containing protein [Christensenellales bacterium]|nr:HD domain-containing protein [Christensenellales bacterium]